MTARLLILLPLSLFFFNFSCSKRNDIPPRLLVFSKTEAFRHDCIPTAVDALRKLCKENGILMDSTENADDFTEKNLSRYAAVVFLNTTGDVLNPIQETDFERYIQAGGGFVGIHSATDTEYGWSWYGGLVGGYFNGHPHNQDATLHVLDHQHASTKHLGETWQRFDEWYNLRDVNPNVNVLLNLDETTYEGGTMGDKHPAAWYHEYDGGRAFYTAGGHTKESYNEPDFLKHLLGGLKYAIGSNRRLDYGACSTDRRPDPTRFVKTVLASELTEPMELDMFPNGKVIFVERRGAIKLYDPATELTTVAYKLPVHIEHEDGLMGLALDPNWEQNHWIYLYYSPVGKESVNVLSRFKFVADTLDRASEQIILKVPTQRDECCHTGGSIEFDERGVLYLSTGDNTNPFDSRGYSPSDERPRRSAWDAQKSSANTMDLRGKILRIFPLPEGGYVCPKNNLFTDTEVRVAAGKLPELNGKGRPEIYVMGCRNPFRISIDSRRDLLFWGEVGPDAGDPDPELGPQGHDEVNRAKEAGFFGWPYFVGDNKPYREYNFATKKSGPPHDPAHPVNNSPFNTGAKELPPAQPAFIWYPYGNSKEFPLTGNGGRNAMAGPVYYTDKYPAETRFPEYYNGKLITYDWMRNWMMAVTIDSMGDFSRMEPLFDSLKFSRPMDMIVDRNGSVWILEYGTQWFASNPDARLSRIDYVRGNRPPQAHVAVDKTAGAAPCSVIFSIGKSRDYDGDRLEYTLNFGDGSKPVKLHDRHRRKVAMAGIGEAPRLSKLDSIAHTYTLPGTYEVVLTATDPRGAVGKSKVKINVGNEAPTVFWDFKGRNRSFYRPGDTLYYQVEVVDQEDGSLLKGQIAPQTVAANIDYLATGFDITAIAQGHQTAMQQTEYAKGKSLIDKSDCKTCHATDRLVNGPAYQSIAARYRTNEFAVRELSQKIIKGGAGNWGQTVMSAHPQISLEDAGEMVRWILTLADAPKVKQTIALAGQYVLSVPADSKTKKAQPGTYLFKATYKDKGSKTQTPLENGETIALRPTFQQAEMADSMSKNITHYRPFKGDTVVLKDLKHGSFFVFRHVDLTGIHSVMMGIGSGDKRYQYAGGRVEIRLDSADGPMVGQAVVPAFNQKETMVLQELNINLDAGKFDGNFHDLFFVLRNENKPSELIGAVDWVRFDLML
ncbi:MAG: ThuA domain-containing protein, partial [Saprospiraceae bacterium]|nr:ThuA domain-containing protein [Saprospiraceae bacterium]